MARKYLPLSGRRPPGIGINSAPPGDGTLTVAWTNSGDDEVTGYELRYSDLIHPDNHLQATAWQYRWDNIPGTSPLEYTIDGLVNGTDYKVQARGRNKYGDWGDWGNWVPLLGQRHAADDARRALGPVGQSGQRFSHGCLVPPG